MKGVNSAAHTNPLCACKYNIKWVQFLHIALAICVVSFATFCCSDSANIDMWAHNCMYSGSWNLLVGNGFSYHRLYNTVIELKHLLPKTVKDTILKYYNEYVIVSFLDSDALTSRPIARCLARLLAHTQRWVSLSSPQIPTWPSLASRLHALLLLLLPPPPLLLLLIPKVSLIW
jgi:hypothetical protein